MPSDKLEKKLQLQTKSDATTMPPSILTRNITPPIGNPQRVTTNASTSSLPASPAPASNSLEQLQSLEQSQFDNKRATVIVPGISHFKGAEKIHSDSVIPTISSFDKSLNTKNESDKNISNSPTEFSHHKSPSVHAHFDVDEELRRNKMGNRSRSGSASNNPLFLSFSRDGSKSQESFNKENQTGASFSLSADPTKSQQALNSNLNSNSKPSPEQNSNIDPRLPQDDGKIHILFGICGALSAGKIKSIIGKIFEIYTPEKVAIQLIMTKSSENFLLQESLNILENKGIRIWKDSDEWTTWKTRSDPVLHIELRRWADILVICPLTANTLSKISLGLCDNLLTNVIRAWNTSYPILLAPAMGSYSYNAITTKRQLRLIAEEMPWIEVLKPSEKVFGSYGDIGMGGMMDWNEVVNKIVLKLGGYPDVEEDDEEEEGDIDDDNDIKQNSDKERSAVHDDDDDDDDDEEEEEDDEEDDDDDDDDDQDDS
ncbi:SIS2 [Candida oxycetoniae]|uniref:SIS2 n=1 Tax=Candida oxycetoniae TaxID=497107 RepID=A0AAI9SYG1_9ASCO|nr:SIS2 [Candida oxycetoniae]KAI3405291.2 SIS2 [Candida oxycetoniae]